MRSYKRFQFCNKLFTYTYSKKKAINVALRSLSRSRYMDKFYSQRQWLSCKLFVYLLKMV